MAEIISTPEVTFHGAPRKVMQSIVRYGFVIPEKHIGHIRLASEIACGASFENGIYFSPSIGFAGKRRWKRLPPNGSRAAMGLRLELSL